MTGGFGRFTVYGGPALEAELTRLAVETADLVRGSVPAQNLQALVLLGGYGRGEGGVLVRNGREAPHNNFDFLLVTRGVGSSGRRDLKDRLAPQLTALGAPLGLGMDLSVISARGLRSAPALVLWYDMRFGHKTLAGDAGFVPSLAHQTVDRVPATDVLRLMVNRGTLFLLNDLIMERGDGGRHHRRTVVKHAVKGIIGYGDAFLFSRGRYHWSYRARRSAMKACGSAAGALAELYDEALGFRFRPDYQRFDGLDLAQWSAGVVDTLEGVHLEFERWRLDMPELTWRDYAAASFQQAALEGIRGPRAVARSLRNALAAGPYPGPGGLAAKLGHRFGGRRAVLDAVFPALAYPGAAAGQGLALDLLGAGDASRIHMVEAYLRHWGISGDDNLAGVLNSLNLNRRAPREPAKRSVS